MVVEIDNVQHSRSNIGDSICIYFYMLYNSGTEQTSLVYKNMMIQHNSILIHTSGTSVFIRLFFKNILILGKKKNVLSTYFPGFCVYVKQIVTCDI